MKLTKSFFKSTKGIILIALSMLTVVACVVGALAATLYTKVSESDNPVPLMAITDALVISFDEKKLTHLYQSELAMVDAVQAAEKRNYTKMHSSFETAVAEMSDAVGENSALTCTIISIQSVAEGSFGKWPIVEGLERRIIKALPATKQCKQMIAYSKMRLRHALENQGKYDEALQAHSENLAYAEKHDISADKKNVQEALQSLSEFYERFQVYDKAFETTDRLLVLVKSLPAGEMNSSRIPLILLEEAELKGKAHKFPEAIVLYAEIINLDPNLSMLYSQRGYMYKHHLHQYPLAIADYSKAIDLFREQEKKSKELTNRAYSPINFLLLRRAVAYSENKEYAKALSDLSVSLSNDPDYAAAYDRRAEVCSKMGSLERALSDFDKAIKSSRGYTDASCYMLRGDAYRRAGHYKEALADYETCLLKAPKDPRSFTNRAAMFEQFGQHQKALADYATAEKCLAQFAPKHLLVDTMDNMPEWKERMAANLYDGRAKVYDSLQQKKLADADRAKAKLLAKVI